MVSIDNFKIGNRVINIHNKKIGIINSIFYDHNPDNNPLYFVLYKDKTGEFLNNVDIIICTYTNKEPI